MAKRGESGLSLLIAVDKPQGMTSHDVVNRCRRIFGERRVGHTGTLDPLATGVLPLCIGPATRLDRYLTGHDKRYRATIAFGFETTTDDSEGEPTVFGEASDALLDPAYAKACLAGLVGCHDQVPPRYSAIKVNGQRAYKAAQSGQAAKLEPRPVEVYQADFVSCQIDGNAGLRTWTVDFSVSKGTYIRALARDLGRAIGFPAHLCSLQRRACGRIRIEDCLSLETIENLGVDAAIDPVAALGLRYAFADACAQAVSCGAKLSADALVLNEACELGGESSRCACTGSVVKSADGPRAGELISLVAGNKLRAIYSYGKEDGLYKPACVFSVGVARR